MKAIHLSLVLPLFLCQCAKEEKEGAPAVGVVKTTTHEFTLHVGPEGTLYTVRDGSGQVIAKEVSAGELAATHPQLSEELKSLYAGNQILQSTFRDPKPVVDQSGEAARETREVKSRVDGLPVIPDLQSAPQ